MNRDKWKVGKHSRLRLMAKLTEEVGEAAQEVGNFYDVKESRLGRATSLTGDLERKRLEKLAIELDHVILMADVLRKQTRQELESGVWQ